MEEQGEVAMTELWVADSTNEKEPEAEETAREYLSVAQNPQ